MKHSVTAFYAFLSARGMRQMNRLLGRACVGCQRESRFAVCEKCLSMLKKPQWTCIGCGIELPAEVQGQKCQACLQKAPPFIRLDYLGNYEGLLADLIVAAKVGRQPNAIEAINHIMKYRLSESNQLFNAISDQDYWLLPTPIPQFRLMRRGFNLPRLLAKNIQARYPLPIVPSRVVILPRATQKQALLTQEKRKSRRFSYQIRDKLPQKIIIVDDVITTTQTVRELALFLQNNGVQSVAVWSLGRRQWES